MDRRRFLQTGGALTVSSALHGGAASAATSTGVTARDGASHATVTGQTAGASMPGYPPYPSAAATEAAFSNHVGPAMVKLMKAIGTEIHYGDRRGPRVQDAYSGRWYWDCHRNGSLYNLGHRNPVILAAIREALQQLEVGNLFLVSGYKAYAAEQLVASTDARLTGVTYTASGAEANEVAIRTARGFTRRTRLVSLRHSYHGSSCFTMAAGDNAEFRKRYLLDFEDFVKVPYNDLAAMEAAVDGTTAAVLLETSPAQLGFPEPIDGYFEAVRKICDRHGALLILDEVQTGLGATGSFWYWQQFGIVPDMITTAKGLGGGIMSNAAVLMAPRVQSWFFDTEFPHMSTFGGNELGCVATAKVCEITASAVFQENVSRLIRQFREGFADAPFRFNQIGLCMGLIAEKMTNVEMTRRLFEAGVMVVPASYDEHAIEFRPMLILEETEAEEIISTVRRVLG